jgi:23S rRNA pseudouridine1911/1915/1917 synthase
MPEADSILVTESQRGVRLDRFLASRFPESSRGRFHQLITESAVQVNGQPAKPTYNPRAGDLILIQWPEPIASEVLPEEIPVEVLFEDEDLLVVNKSADLVVHPSAGHANGTLVNALLHHCAGRLSGIGGVERPGIVHRLDLGTSGCLVVAKSDAAHIHLSAQFANRLVQKVYQCIVIGSVQPLAGDIRAPIERHNLHRKKMTVASLGEGREAWTSYRLEESLAGSGLVKCLLHTGRTHQIRVHMAHLGFPVLGDEIYGERANARFRQQHETGVKRQMLHARTLSFTHPKTGLLSSFEAPLPQDFIDVLEQLR